MDNLRLSLEDWLAVNIKSGGDNDSITVPDLFSEFVKDNKNIHVTYPMFAMVSGRLTGFTALRENLENQGKVKKILKFRENLEKPGSFFRKFENSGRTQGKFFELKSIQ